MKQQISSRKEVALLVSSFYQLVRADELLGPIFNKAIAEDEWPAHLDKLTDFWETNLFGVRKFKGNPQFAHRKVDKENNYGIEQLHFGRWLNLWFTTIDRLFEGSRAERAKQAARKMSTGLFLAIWHGRP